MANDTLSITDNRTGRQYELAIANGALRAADLRQIRVSDEDPGLTSYDPGFLNTASCQSGITLIDGERGVLRYLVQDQATFSAIERCSS
jgi:citrate synthase